MPSFRLRGHWSRGHEPSRRSPRPRFSWQRLGYWLPFVTCVLAYGSFELIVFMPSGPRAGGPRNPGLVLDARAFPAEAWLDVDGQNLWLPPPGQGAELVVLPPRHCPLFLKPKRFTDERSLGRFPFAGITSVESAYKTAGSASRTSTVGLGRFKN